MTISEKSAYLKGLMDGLNLDTEKAEVAPDVGCRGGLLLRKEACL